MKFSTKQDIEAPAAFVFAALTDFEGWERAAMRRGADVARTDKMRQAGAGMSWHVAFQFRGRQRKMDLRLLNMIPNSKLEFAALSAAIDAATKVEIVEMSAKRARLHVAANITPLTLTAKLFMQSLRLARARADRKFAQRVQTIVTEIEARYRDDQKVS
jgi:uncharacterized protein YndB with AHSA1/START domain